MESESTVQSTQRGLLGALALAACLSSCSEPETVPPNLLLYVSDTLRADGLACYGNTIVETPHIDRLAREGALFESALAPSSWTRASMGAILSGTMPAVHGAEGRYDLLEDSVVLLSEMLEPRGYASANITTNRNVGAFFGFDQGYEEGSFIELYAPSEDRMVSVRELTARADAATDEAIAWLETVTEPFCLIVHTVDPHSPYVPLPEWDRYGGESNSTATGTHDSLFALGKERTQADVDRILSLYYGEIAFNDSAFGSLVDWLKERELFDRTITIFTSDHGEEFWELGERGHGKTVNEKALHVPLIIRYPGQIDRGRIRGLVSLVDIVPTVLDMTGTEQPEWVEGRSLFDSTRSEVFSSCFLGSRELVTLREDRWKLVLNLSQGTSALFDMQGERGERRDVARQNREVAGELTQTVRAALEAQREKRVSLHGAERAPSVDELPDEVERDLDGMGYFGDD